MFIKAKNRINTGMNKIAVKLMTGQKGELPSWVNMLMIIVIIIVLGIAVYTFLSPTIKDGIKSYVDRMFNSIV